MSTIREDEDEEDDSKESWKQDRSGMFHARPRGAVSPTDWTIPGRRSPQNPRFYLPGPGSPTPHSYPWPRPACPPTPHFYRQGPGQPGPQPLTSLGQPLTSIGQTPHFYLPCQAAPCRTASTVLAMSAPGLVWPVSPCQADTGTSLMLSGFGKLHCCSSVLCGARNPRI